MMGPTALCQNPPKVAYLGPRLMGDTGENSNISLTQEIEDLNKYLDLMLLYMCE